MPSWPDLFGNLLAVQVAAWTTAIVLLTVLIGKVWPRLRRLVKLVDALSALPGFMDRTESELQKQTEQIAEIHHEVNFNGGGSVKDTVADLRQTVERLDTNVEGLLKVSARLTGDDAPIRKEKESE